jgi:GNAT superfamily N-acetyltransferase
MEISFKECPLSDWQNAAKKISGMQEVFPHQNVFASLQYFGKDAALKASRKAYCMQVDGAPKAWAMTYFISEKVIRARALYVEEGFRGRGLMSGLLKNIEDLYSGRAEKIILFVKDDSIPFYLKCGFRVVEKFQPRPTEFFDTKTNSYVSPADSVLTLMEKKMGGDL